MNLNPKIPSVQADYQRMVGGIADTSTAGLQQMFASSMQTKSDFAHFTRMALQEITPFMVSFDGAAFPSSDTLSPMTMQQVERAGMEEMESASKSVYVPAQLNFPEPIRSLVEKFGWVPPKENKDKTLAKRQLEDVRSPASSHDPNDEFEKAQGTDPRKTQGSRKGSPLIRIP